MAWPVFEEYSPENAKAKKKAARKSDEKGPDKKEVFRLNKVRKIFAKYFYLSISLGTLFPSVQILSYFQLRERAHEKPLASQKRPPAFYSRCFQSHLTLNLSFLSTCKLPENVACIFKLYSEHFSVKNPFFSEFYRTATISSLKMRLINRRESTLL